MPILERLDSVTETNAFRSFSPGSESRFHPFPRLTRGHRVNRTIEAVAPLHMPLRVNRTIDAVAPLHQPLRVNRTIDAVAPLLPMSRMCEKCRKDVGISKSSIRVGLIRLLKLTHFEVFLFQCQGCAKSNPEKSPSMSIPIPISIQSDPIAIQSRSNPEKSLSMSRMCEKCRKEAGVSKSSIPIIPNSANPGRVRAQQTRGRTDTCGEDVFPTSPLPSP